MGNANCCSNDRAHIDKSKCKLRPRKNAMTVDEKHKIMAIAFNDYKNLKMSYNNSKILEFERIATLKDIKKDQKLEIYRGIYLGWQPCIVTFVNNGCFTVRWFNCNQKTTLFYKAIDPMDIRIKHYKVF